MSAATTRAPALANSCVIDLADALAAAGDDDGAAGEIETRIRCHRRASSGFRMLALLGNDFLARHPEVRARASRRLARASLEG